MIFTYFSSLNSLRKGLRNPPIETEFSWDVLKIINHHELVITALDKTRNSKKLIHREKRLYFGRFWLFSIWTRWKLGQKLLTEARNISQLPLLPFSTMDNLDAVSQNSQELNSDSGFCIVTHKETEPMLNISGEWLIIAWNGLVYYSWSRSSVLILW